MPDDGRGVRAEGQAVNGVHDHGRVEDSRGRPPKYACLGAVRVHDVGLKASQQREQPAQREAVQHGVELAAHFRRQVHLHGPLPGATDQLALGSKRRPSEQAHVV